MVCRPGGPYALFSNAFESESLRGYHPTLQGTTLWDRGMLDPAQPLLRKHSDQRE